MKTLTTLLLLSLAVWPAVLSVNAQQPAPPVEFSPQEPPKATAILEGGNPTNVFEAAISCLTTNGFSVIKRDRREFVLEVRKKMPGASKDYDKVLLWLARDAANPAVLKAYVSFGRYIELFGTGGKLGRRVLEKDVEEAMTATWRPQLIEALERTGE